MIERTPADLKAARELCGLSQQALADLLGVNKRSVKRWERGDNPAPQDAWDVIDRQLEHHDAAVEHAEMLLDQMEQADNLPSEVTLTYWRDQAEYDAHGRDEGYYGCANANARTVADVLRANGVPCSFRYFDGGAVSTPESRY